MKHPLFLLMLLLGSSKLFSQHGSLTLSDDFKIAEGEYKHQTVTNSIYHNNAFYTVTNSGVSAAKWLFTKLYDARFSVTLARFDRDMNKIREIVLENGERNFGPLTPRLVPFNNKLYLAYFKAVDKASFNVYLAAIDENDLSLSPPKTICTIQQKNVNIFEIESVIESGIVYFAVSPDNTRLLAAIKSAPNKVQTTVLDDKLEVLKQASVKVSSTSFEIPSAVLTNDNTPCLILESPEGTRILGINANGEKTELRYNASGNFSPYTTRAQLAKDGKSIFIYSTTTQSGESASWCNGLMVSRLDPANFKLAKPLTYELAPEFVQRITERGGGEKHKRNYFMYNFIPHMLELDGGDIVIVGSPEGFNVAYSHFVPDMWGQNRTRATSTLTIGPVIALFPNKNGKTLDQVIIPRKIELRKFSRSGSGAIQIVQAPGMSDVTAGFITRQLGEDVIVIYNDNVKNLAKSADAKTTASRSPGELELAEALINKDRKLEYRKLIREIKQNRATFYLAHAIPTTSGTIVFPVGKEGIGFNALKTYYTNWCFLDIK